MNDDADERFDAGFAAYQAGKLREAEVLFLRALELFEAVEGTTRSQANCHLNLGNVYWGRGLLADAEAAYLRALALYETVEDTTRSQAG